MRAFVNRSSNVFGMIFGVFRCRVEGSDAAGTIALWTKQPAPDVGPWSGFLQRPAVVQRILDCCTNVLVWMLSHYIDFK